jgi:hypothetical protein
MSRAPMSKGASLLDGLHGSGPLVLFSRRFCLWWVTLLWATAVEAVRFGHGAPSVFVACRTARLNMSEVQQKATKVMGFGVLVAGIPNHDCGSKLERLYRNYDKRLSTGINITYESSHSCSDLERFLSFVQEQSCSSVEVDDGCKCQNCKQNQYRIADINAKKNLQAQLRTAAELIMFLFYIICNSTVQFDTRRIE